MKNLRIIPGCIKINKQRGPDVAAPPGTTVFARTLSIQKASLAGKQDKGWPFKASLIVPGLPKAPHRLYQEVLRGDAQGEG